MLAQDHTVSQDLYWPSQQKTKKKLIWEQLENIQGARHFNYYPSRAPWHLVSNHQPYCLLFKTPTGPSSKTKVAGGRTTLHYKNPNQTFNCLWILQWPYQPQACLKSVWITSFLICIHEAKPWNSWNVSLFHKHDWMVYIYQLS